MSKTQLSDFDEDLSEELRLYDEFRDGKIVKGTINRVEQTDNDGIRVYVDMPWNEEIYRFFKKPQDDPDDLFERFVKGIGYDLNASHNIPEEEVPCKYNEEDEKWQAIIPKTRWGKISSMFSLDPEEDDDFFISTGIMLALFGGYVILAPIVNVCLWFHIVLGDEDPLAAAFYIGIIIGLINIIWYLGWRIFYFGGNDFIPYLPL